MTNEKLAEIIIENIQYRLNEWGDILLQRIDALHMASCNKDFDYKMAEEIQREIEKEMKATKLSPIASNTFEQLHTEWEDGEP